MSKISNPQTSSIFDYISDQVDGADVMSIDDHGTISFTEPTGAYEKVLGDHGLTLDQAKTVQEVNANFITAATAAGGELAVDYMRNNSKAESAVLEFAIGHDTHTVSYSRGGEITNINQTPYINDNGDMMNIKNRLAKLFDEIDSEEDADDDAA